MRTWMLSAAVALLGCVPSDGDLDGGLGGPDGMLDRRVKAPLPLDAFRVAAADALAPAGPGVRFVAMSNHEVQSDYTCAVDGEAEIRFENGKFVIGHLFLNAAELPEDDAVELAPVPKILRRFCLVEWAPNNGLDLPPAAVVAAARARLDEAFDDWGEDLQVGGAQADALENEVVNVLAPAWRRQLDVLRPLPEPLPGFQPTRIAIADTSPRSDTGDANEGLSDHGWAMGRIAQVLSCPPGGACLGYVAHHLALPRVDGVRRPALGGYYGYQGEIARAIGESVQRWLEAAPAEGRGHLVINLSLGWDGIYGGAITTTPDADLKPPVRAAYLALQYAACQGALVVAAAGNRSGGPNESVGPLYPAGWEKRPTPSAEDCQALGFPGVVDGSPYQPLVYAVSGVRPDDIDLGNRRPGGRPRLVAPAFQAVVGVPSDPPGMGLVSSGINTGSSVAAAAVSSVAAVIWAYRPDLGPHAVMQAIYDHGVPLSPALDGSNVLAEFCLGSTCNGLAVRRLSMCQAVAAVCAGGAGRCPAVLPPCDATPAPYSGRPNALVEALADLQQFAVDDARVIKLGDGAVLTANLAPPRACPYARGATMRTATRNAKVPGACPSNQFALREGAPWAAPQPWGGVCPSCLIAMPVGLPQTSEVDLFSNKEFSKLTFFDGLITFKDKTGKLLGAVPLKEMGILSFKGGDVIQLTAVPVPSGFAHAYLETLTYIESQTKPGTYELTSTLDELAQW